MSQFSHNDDKGTQERPTDRKGAHLTRSRRFGTSAGIAAVVIGAVWIMRGLSATDPPISPQVPEAAAGAAQTTTTRPPFDAPLAPEPESRSISATAFQSGEATIRVVRRTDSIAVEGAKILRHDRVQRLADDIEAVATTNAQGLATFDQERIGDERRVVVTAEGFLPTEAVVEDGPKPTTIALEEGESLRLTFVDQRDGSPVPGVSVAISAVALPPMREFLDSELPLLDQTPTISGSSATFRRTSDKNGSVAFTSLRRAKYAAKIASRWYCSVTPIETLVAPGEYTIPLVEAWVAAVVVSDDQIISVGRKFSSGSEASHHLVKVFASAAADRIRSAWPKATVIVLFPKGAALPCKASLFTTGRGRIDAELPVVRLKEFKEPHLLRPESPAESRRTTAVSVLFVTPNGQQHAFPDYVFEHLDGAQTSLLGPAAAGALPAGRYRVAPPHRADEKYFEASSFELDGEPERTLLIPLKKALVPVTVSTTIVDGGPVGLCVLSIRSSQFNKIYSGSLPTTLWLDGNDKYSVELVVFGCRRTFKTFDLAADASAYDLQMELYPEVP